MSPRPVLLGRFPVPRKFSKGFSRLPLRAALRENRSGVSVNEGPSRLASFRMLAFRTTSQSATFSYRKDELIWCNFSVIFLVLFFASNTIYKKLKCSQ
jgi:hypothetical protein